MYHEPFLSTLGHRSKIKWIAIHVPNWCTGDVYPSSILIPWDVDPRPGTLTRTTQIPGNYGTVRHCGTDVRW
jgi:hypothetical protein